MNDARGTKVAPAAPIGVIAASARRCFAMMLRYVYILRGSWPRIIELCYWPLMQMVLWGFSTEFLRTNSSWVAQAAGALIGAALLWDVMFRGQLGFTISFLEEMWSRNLPNLFVTPLRPYEFVLALTGMSVIRTLLGTIPAALLAILFYRFSIFDLGLPLVGFFANLMMLGWAVGLVITAIIMRYGLGAESLAWMAMFALAPVSGVFYPIATLPEWMQPVSWALPSAYVFEGMRAILVDGVYRADYLVTALVLNLGYLALGGAVFLWSFHVSRRDGLLMKVGE
jgi:ABC-2 type transport system permease protein